MTSLKNSALNGMKWTTISTGVVTLSQFLQFALLAKILDPAAIGIMSMIMVVLNFAQMYVDMGISNAIIQKKDVSENQLSSLYWFNWLLGIAVFVIVLLVNPLIVMYYQENGLAVPLYWASLIFLITPLGQQYKVILRKSLKFKVVAVIEAAASVVGLFATLLLALIGYEVLAIIWGYLLSALFRSIAFTIVGRKISIPSRHYKFEEVKSLLGFGLYQLGERTVFFLNANLDTLLIGKFLGAHALGVYMLAVNLVIVPILKINPMITNVMFPIFSKMQDEDERLKKGYFKVLQTISLINFPILAGIFLTGPNLIPIIFGHQWTESIAIVQLLVVIGIMRVIGNPIGSLLMAKGRVDLGFKWHVMMLVTIIPALSLGAYYGGILGLCYGYMFYQAIYLITNYTYLIRRVLGPSLASFIGSFGPALLYSSFMVIVIQLAEMVLPVSSPLISVGWEVVAGVILYTLCIYRYQKQLITDMAALLGRKSKVKEVPSL